MEGGDHKSLREPKMIKGDGALIFEHFDYFEKQTHLVRSVFQRVYRLFSHESSTGKIQPLL